LSHLGGGYTQGATLEETVGNIQDAIKLRVDGQLVCGEEIPGSEVVTIMTMEIEV
jgi:predicted RNase H-like HicB family nuclease